MKNKIWNYFGLEEKAKDIFRDLSYDDFFHDIRCGGFYYLVYILETIEKDGYEERDKYFKVIGELPELFHESELFGIECSIDGTCYVYKTTDMPVGLLVEEVYRGTDIWKKNLKEFYSKVTLKNSFKIDQLNFYDILCQFRKVLKEKPQYLLFWYDEQNKVYLEIFEDKDPMRKRVDEIKRVVGEEDVED